MSSQFEKRKARIEAELKEKRAEIRDKAPISGDSPVAKPTPVEIIDPNMIKEPRVFTHEGFDIFLEGRYFKAVTFKYNPESRVVEIIDIAPIERAVGLSYENQKRALRTLLRKK